MMMLRPRTLEEDGLTPFDGVLSTGAGRYVGFVRGSAQLTQRGWEGRIYYQRAAESSLVEPNPYRLQLRGGETLAISIAVFGIDEHSEVGEAAFIHGSEVVPCGSD